MMDSAVMAEERMSAIIDKRASIDPSAKIASGVRIGPWTHIGPNVVIGADTVIGSNVVIECNTTIGERNQIHSFTSIGGDPQDLSYRGEQTWLEIGDDNIIREYVTVNRGSSRGAQVTRLGNKNCLLAYSHVAHDCQIGNSVLFINHATTAGHAVVEDHAILGAYTAMHQFCRIGAYSFLSRATEVSRDIPPFMIVKGIPGYPCGLNLVGLRRNGFTAAAIRGLKQAYRILYNRGIRLEEAKQQLQELAVITPEVQMLLDFIPKSTRGLARRHIGSEEIDEE